MEGEGARWMGVWLGGCWIGLSGLGGGALGWVDNKLPSRSQHVTVILSAPFRFLFLFFHSTSDQLVVPGGVPRGGEGGGEGQMAD